MSDEELDYDDLDALLEDGNDDLMEGNSKDENSNSQEGHIEPPNSTDDRVDFNTVIGNTMSRLNNMKLNDNKEDTLSASEGFMANDNFFNGDGAELFNDLIAMMQTKENFYEEIISLRDHLDEWIKKNPTSKIIKDRELQLDNLNKRISIYERQDYTDAKYREELKKLALEYVQIPHPYVIGDQRQGEAEGEDSYKFDGDDELIALLSKELIRKETIYESAIEYREDLKQWIKEHPDADEKVLASRKQEVEIYDEVIAVYESPDYSPDNKYFNEKVMSILDKTKYLYEPLPLAKGGSNDKVGEIGEGAPYHQLKEEFFDTIEKFTTKAMEEINTFDKTDAGEGGGMSSEEQKALLQEIDQNCPPQ